MDTEFRIKGKFNNTITSYGLIVFCTTTNPVKVLLYQARDSYEFIDFMRGNWNTDQHVFKLLSRTTGEERLRLASTYTFDEMYNDLHMGDAPSPRDEKARKKFDKIKEKLPLIIETLPQPTAAWWNFPKGKKKNEVEDEIECAKREFEEETRIPASDLTIISKSSLYENYWGTDGKRYSSQYFVATINNMPVPDKLQTPLCIRKESVSCEASEIKWMTVDEAKELMVSRRYNLLTKAVEMLPLI